LAAIFGVVATFLAVVWTWQEAERRDRERFDVQVEITRQMFDWETEKYEQALNGVREWMGWVEVPSLDDWNNLLDRLDLPVTFPGLARIGYAPYSALVSRWKERVPKHWAAIWPEGYLPETRDRLAYDSRIEPWKKWSTEPVVMQAKGEGDTYSAAYLTGTLKTTGRIELVGPDGRRQPGYRAYLAVYARDLLPPSSSIPENQKGNQAFRSRQRMNAFLGAVVAEVAIEPLMRQICQNPELELELYAGPIAETNRLNRLDQAAFADSEEYRRGLHRNYEVPWYGSRWTLAFRTTPAFRKNSNHSRAGWVGVSGLVLTTAVAALMWVESVGRRRAEKLSRELSRARDELHAVHAARTQLQRNLHDAVLQRLYAAALHARRTWQAASRGESVQVHELGIQVSELDDAMSELRNFLGGSTHRELTPAELALALRGLCLSFSRQTGVVVSVDVVDEALVGLAGGSGEHLLQMVREGLSNAWRHGKARQLHVRWTPSSESLVIEIEDDGSGFNPTVARQSGQGLRNLAERAVLCGGALEIDSRIGGPTTLRITVPRASPLANPISVPSSKPDEPK
jgi:signal transduction histidine kinase